MKKLFIIGAIGFVLSCNNETKTTTENGQSSPVTTGVDNVHGNQPETTGTINLNQPLPKDSSNLKDSTHH